MSQGPVTLPRWRPLAAARPAMPPVWWHWVASRDSLTRRLVAAGAPRAFRVRLLDQRIDRPHRDEALALGIPIAQWAWLREVALCLDERPWVLARSVAPLSRLRGQRLERLGDRSLGSWLFRQPDLIRGPLEATADPPPFGHTLPVAAGPWGRRSVLRHGHFAVLVQEFFLASMADDLGLPSR
ncbi:chorismate--pyruvate lyase [Halomonas cerina]|uniref:Probable chorismate pyruvate-lyase n=2 Tax=Halomonas cerina TaxID=447424 RepID=A0A839VC10_9GAMM|nr:chorismate--pyruvate lyase [Halomonas cerina]